MIRTNQTFRAASFTVVAITLLACCRWMPTVEKEDASTVDSASNISLVAFTTTNPDGDRVVIAVSYTHLTLPTIYSV